MKTRVTFRVADDLADELRELPNQTQFVENVLRDALGLRCPTCDGNGRVTTTRLRISNFKRFGMPAPDRTTAMQLQALVRLARQLAATDVDLGGRGGASGFGFSLRRGRTVLLRGKVVDGATKISPNPISLDLH